MESTLLLVLISHFEIWADRFVFFISRRGEMQDGCDEVHSDLWSRSLIG